MLSRLLYEAQELGQMGEELTMRVKTSQEEVTKTQKDCKRNGGRESLKSQANGPTGAILDPFAASHSSQTIISILSYAEPSCQPTTITRD